MIRGHRMRDVLQDDGLAGFRRRHDQAALAFPDRGDDVDDAAGEVFFGLDVPLEDERDGGVERGEVFEEDLVLGIFGWLRVDLVHLHERKVALTVLWGSNLPFYRVPRVQIEPSDLGG